MICTQYEVYLSFVAPHGNDPQIRRELASYDSDGVEDLDCYTDYVAAKVDTLANAERVERDLAHIITFLGGKVTNDQGVAT